MTQPHPPSADGALRRVELPGSRVLSIRPVRGTDAPALVALFASLDEDDHYYRFFSGHALPEAFVQKMTQVEERGGCGLVAVVEAPGEPSRLVGEASCEPLPNGNGELGITVAEDARGWLGPYLLDALVEQAAARGVPNLEAEVMMGNRRMLALLRSRGYAVMGRYWQPAVVRVVIGTTGGAPGWPRAHERRRLLVEVPGGHWHGEETAREAGFEVVACPGPAGGWERCPALHGEPCPLVAGADMVVDAVPDPVGGSLLETNRRLHPTVPLCVEVPVGADEADDDDVPRLRRDTGETVVIGLLQRLAKAPPES